ncbi:MAG: dioxygenase [Rhodocyclales bacterium]|nr:dioxygenase [Rhodocyclales bacterium]
MLPSVFVPHGSPTFALDPGEAGIRLAAAAAALPRRPRAIVVASAHWDTPDPMVGAAERPQTVHDFWGFPEPLYDLRYPAPGAPDLAATVVDLLHGAGLPAQATQQGLDHAVWIPLRQMFPQADVPVVPLSIQSARGPKYHYRLGQALATLRELDVLVIGSGNLTHSLRDVHAARVGGGDTPPYVRAFADWIWRCIEVGDTTALFDYRRRAPEAPRAHPTEDHLLPLFVALGAAGANAQPERFHAGVDTVVLAMDAFAFHPAEGARE